MAFLVLCTIALLFVLYFVGATVLEWVKAHSTGYKKQYETERAKRIAAEKGLRAIANNLAGNAVLEATATLDEMENIR